MSSVRRLTTLSLCRAALACGGLSSDYDWNGVGVKELHFVDNFWHLLHRFNQGICERRK